MLRRTPAVPGRSSVVARASKRRRTRGQSLVEFALVLPILLFLTLIALDFGRVYLGYINLQNMARIAANFAGNNPSAWDAVSKPTDAELKDKYFHQIIADAQAINCDLVDTNGDGDIDADDFVPTFTDQTGNGVATDAGDIGEVQIGCRFAVITPGIANVVGGSVDVAGASRFPVKNGMIASGPGGGPGGGVAPNAAFSGNGVITSVSATSPSITGNCRHTGRSSSGTSATRALTRGVAGCAPAVSGSASRAVATHLVGRRERISACTAARRGPTRRSAGCGPCA